MTANLPPLRDRGEDIALLANLFMHRYANEFNRRVKCFSGASLKKIIGYEWPGNIRELENRVKRAVVMTETKTIEPQDLGFQEDSDNYITETKDLHGVVFQGKRDSVLLPE